jgi:hypothetical protein
MPFEFNSKYRKESTKKLIKDIFLIEEEDLELAFSDLDDFYDVDINYAFYVKSPKNHLFEVFGNKSDEVIESYAASGFTPVIKIQIIQRSSLENVRTAAIECVNNLEDYYLWDVKGALGKRGDFYFELMLAMEELESDSPKGKYHNKTLSYFQEKYKSDDFTLKLVKNFEVDGKYYLKYQDGLENKKVYTLIFEKTMEVSLEMIDVLSKFKEDFLDMFYDIEDNDEFHDLSYDMDIIEKEMKKRSIIFSLTFYEN